ncbi:MAG: hypothetical protein R3F37_17920 [Candidatus Competibacteraceae bacterium]
MRSQGAVLGVRNNTGLIGRHLCAKVRPGLAIDPKTNTAQHAMLYFLDALRFSQDGGLLGHFSGMADDRIQDNALSFPALVWRDAKAGPLPSKTSHGYTRPGMHYWREDICRLLSGKPMDSGFAQPDPGIH